MLPKTKRWAVLPVLVVPDGMLWEMVYEDDGSVRRGGPIPPETVFPRAA